MLASHFTGGAGYAGYNLVRRTSGRLAFWAVSDADASALRQFCDDFIAAAARSG